jgi:hypothetical protein
LTTLGILPILILSRPFIRPRSYGIRPEGEDAIEEEVPMRKIIILALLASIPGSASADAGQVSLGISIADGELQSFYLAVGDHYGVPHREVVRVRERYRLRDEELPVAFFLAARARVSPSVLIDLRTGGMSWLDISFRYGLTPDIFFIPVASGRIGPPYGNAYGHYKKYGASRDWKRIVLSDREVVDLVNLRFLSEHHGIPPEKVMEMRGRGQSFVKINGQGAKAKAQGKGKPDKGKKEQAAEGKGKRK